ncbi:hypothetical protein PC110_g5239 [Phytophthora cactorum]|uniref:Uncharacterized protein n=1 Tax=Phytophthora cactorum TaxID=29920 RepID=A0A329SSG2_9STRA|nr:hypothetical protein PC110_g5239 [Phytophthora cactorum]
MSDLLNAEENDAAIKDETQTEDGTINRNATDVPVAVGEPNVTPSGESAEGVAPSWEAPMGTEPLTQTEQEEDPQGRTQETDPSPIDAFGLAYDKFVAEQERRAEDVAPLPDSERCLDASRSPGSACRSS